MGMESHRVVLRWEGAQSNWVLERTQVQGGLGVETKDKGRRQETMAC